MKENLDHLIGKMAYKKLGFFSHLIGIIQKSDGGITPYKLEFKSGGAVGFTRENEIVLYEEQEAEFER